MERRSLDAIELQLTKAAELHMSNVMPDQLYHSAMVGALYELPVLKAPKHIPVLKKLKQWREDDLIPEHIHQEYHAAVIDASRPDEPNSETPDEPNKATVDLTKDDPPPQPGKAKAQPPRKRKRELGQQTMFSWNGTEKQLTRKQDLRAQREAALRGEDYEVETLRMATFSSERDVDEAPAVQHSFSCSKCPKTFDTSQGLTLHARWHTWQTRDKMFKPVVNPQVKPGLSVNGSHVALTLRINGRTLEEVAASAADAEEAAREAETAWAEHAQMRETERKRRQREREAQEADDNSNEHRKGSARRGSYTAKNKLKILEVFDEIMNDDFIKHKVKAFHADQLAENVPYTTACKWAKPAERARLSKAASKEYRQSLLRIDKKNRSKGKYPDMEQEVHRLFKEKRARGRKVSARWISSMARKVMSELHPTEPFIASTWWKCRWAKRFNINMCKRKSNCKNKTFADSEPVLLRYFATLRKRLQTDELTPDEVWVGVEAEPEDINPEPEPAPCRGGGNGLDSSDDETDDETQLHTFASTLPSGMRVAPPPTKVQHQHLLQVARHLPHLYLYPAYLPPLHTHTPHTTTHRSNSSSSTWPPKSSRISM